MTMDLHPVKRPRWSKGGENRGSMAMALKTNKKCAPESHSQT